MPITTNTPLLPPWIGLPVAAVVLIVIAAHLLALQNSAAPPSRKRIRTANGLLMMLVTTLLAYAFSIVTPTQPSLFVLAWLAIIGLLTIVIGVALIDVLNTYKLHREHRRDIRREAARPIGSAAQSPTDSTPADERRDD
jgi:hypothetical protein